MMLQDLRFGRFWLVFGWLSVMVAMILSLAPTTVVELPDWNDKVEHCLGYFLLTFWFCSIYPRQRYWVVGLYMLGMGILVEVLQGVMQLGRQADVRDLVADVIGIAPALLLALTPLGRWPRWFEALVPRS
jgi:VanZ family protein